MSQACPCGVKLIVPYFKFAWITVILLVLRGLKDRFDEAFTRDDVKAVVVTGNLALSQFCIALPVMLKNVTMIAAFDTTGDSGKFSGGFDINKIGDVQGKSELS